MPGQSIWTPPVARSAGERVRERERMVSRQIQFPTDGRSRVSDPIVLDALRAVPRHAFVLESWQSRAYDDSPLPIGHGQTISQPYIVGLMTELLGLTHTSRVLEVGTGSGYQAAVLAYITPHVYTIEIVEPLAERAAKDLRVEGYTSVQVRHGDGYLGWKEAAPFDAIIVPCAADTLPPPLWEQLTPGGRIVIPIGGALGIQYLYVMTKKADGSRETTSVIPVRFVPLTRDRSLTDYSDP